MDDASTSMASEVKPGALSSSFPVVPEEKAESSLWAKSDDLDQSVQGFLGDLMTTLSPSQTSRAKKVKPIKIDIQSCGPIAAEEREEADSTTSNVDDEEAIEVTVIEDDESTEVSTIADGLPFETALKETLSGVSGFFSSYTTAQVEDERRDEGTVASLLDMEPLDDDEDFSFSDQTSPSEASRRRELNTMEIFDPSVVGKSFEDIGRSIKDSLPAPGKMNNPTFEKVMDTLAFPERLLPEDGLAAGVDRAMEAAVFPEKHLTIPSLMPSRSKKLMIKQKKTVERDLLDEIFEDAESQLGLSSSSGRPVSDEKLANLQEPDLLDLTFSGIESGLCGASGDIGHREANSKRRVQPVVNSTQTSGIQPRNIRTTANLLNEEGKLSQIDAKADRRTVSFVDNKTTITKTLPPLVEWNDDGSEESTMDPMDVYIQVGTNKFTQVEGHPGTVAWRDAIQEAARKYNKSDFQDAHFRHIMKAINGKECDFYVGSLEHGWKKLLLSEIRAQTKEAYKRQLNTDEEINSILSRASGSRPLTGSASGRNITMKVIDADMNERELSTLGSAKKGIIGRFLSRRKA